MADVLKLKDNFLSGNLVCDATPDAPRTENSNSVYDRPNLSEDQQEKNEEEANTPLVDENPKSTSNSASHKTKQSTSKSSRRKKKSDTGISYVIVDSSNVKIGNTRVLNYNFTNIQNLGEKSCDKSKKHDDENKTIRQMLPRIQALSESKQVITRDDMLLIKTHLGNGWKEVAKLIGFSKGEIDQLIEDHKHNGIGEVIYKLLVVWKNSRTDKATVGHLVSAMWSSQEYECVERLATAKKVEA